MASGQFQGGGNSATFGALQSIAGVASLQGDPTIPRISARIDGPGGMVGITLSMSIWGMPLSMMNQLSTVGKQYAYIYKNTITVMAGDAVSGMQLVFQGNITTAYVDAQSQPQVCFRVEAQPGAYANVQNTPPTSVKGQADAAQLMQQLAGKAGFQFQNYGVSTKLRNPYLWGAVGNQIKQLAQAGKFEHIIDRGKLSIWNANQGGPGNTLIAPPVMVGYPTFNQNSIYVRKVFDPTIQNMQKITVQSDLTPANGSWQVFHVTHEIESNMPKGKWFTIIGATPIMQETGTD